jgi:hypothetical protein
MESFQKLIGGFFSQLFKMAAILKWLQNWMIVDNLVSFEYLGILCQIKSDIEDFFCQIQDGV